MSYWKWVIFIIALFLLISSVSAVGETVTVTSVKTWVVANDADTSTVTAIVKNTTTGIGIPGVTVDFRLSNTTYGKLLKYSEKTDTSGTASTTFQSFNKSGSVTIRAVANGITATTSQLIDHDTPSSVTFSYDGEVLVGGTTPVVATFTDKWGNLIDNRRTAEPIYFAIGSPEGGGYFYFYNGTGYVQDLTLYTNATGQVGTIVKVDTKAGDNIIYMQHLGSITDKYFTIIGISEGIPYSMTASISPTSYPNPYIHADGTSKFHLYYTLYDAYGNPAGNRTFWVNTSMGETYLLRSNSLGQILATYGPKELVCTVTITARAVDNTSVTNSKDVEFVSAAPTNMVVTANPETMGSWDIPGAQPATVYAKVMDSKGNPVKDETVSFSIDSYSSDTVMTRIPSFSSTAITTTTTAKTGEDGRASVAFYPAAFPTSGSNYDSTATGTATVSAHWGSSVMPIVLTFKNYPYLRVETSVSPPTIEAGKWFDVDLKLIGDGWKLQAKPIDVVVVLDNSRSMDDTDYIIGSGWHTTTVTKLDSAKNAAKVFVNNMTSRDRVGYVAFSQDAKLYQSLTSDLNAVSNKIGYLESDYNTNLRQGVYSGIKELVLNGTAEVQAVIVMTDGNWNEWGTPLGKGTGYPEDNNDVDLDGITTFYTDKYRYIADVDDPGTLTAYESTNCAQYSTTQCDVEANKCKTCASGYTGPDGMGRCKKKIGGTWHYYYPNDLPASCTARQCGTWHCDSYTKYKCLDGYTHEQNLGIYASNNDIDLYTISFGTEVGSDAQEGLDELATTTENGFWSDAPNGAELKNIYEQIAGVLREIAGVDTILNLAFDNVAVTYDEITTTHPGADVFRYDYNTTASTNVTSYNATYNPLPELVTIPTGYTGVNPQYGATTRYPYNFDQSSDWVNSELNFNAGTIRIGQTWETKFRFITYDTVLGNIDIFGPGSVITMHDSEGATTTLTLPHTYVSVVSDLTNIGTTGATLDISNLICTQSGSITDFIPVQWNIAYTGTHTVTEKLSYSTDGGVSWTVFDTNYVTSSTMTDYANLDVRTLPAGEYLIRVDAVAPDSPSDRETLVTPITIGSQGKAFIKLE